MSSPRKPLHVLLVEDSQDDADLILLELREAGYEIASKRVDTEAAMREAMANGRWDIVISDYGLPKFSAHDAMSVLHEADAGIAESLDDRLQQNGEVEVSGWKIQRRNTISLMRKDERRSCPFIIVSGCIGEESAIALMKEGASDFVMKDRLGRLAPVIERELQDALVRQERRQAQDALRKNEKLLRGITSALGEGLLVLDKDGKLLFMNPEAERLLGWTENELLGKRAFDTIYWQENGDLQSESFTQQLSDIMADGSSYRTEGDVFICKDGSLMPVSFIASPIMEQGKMTAAVTAFQDISLRKQAENDLLMSREQLRDLAAHQQSVREEERTRIARELHDELGQMLTGVKLDAMWLASRLSSEQPAIVSKIASMSKLIDETLNAMRRVAADLRPVMLDDLGLAAAAEWLVEDFGERTGIDIRLEMDMGHQSSRCLDADSLKTEVATTVFRIVQECLTNIIRHAQAEHVLVSLECDDDCLMLLVSDDGKGMHVADAGGGKRNSYGIIGMRERAHRLGGKLDILSAPGRGTAIVAIVPVNPVIFAGAMQ